jgi:hypothetical protein
LPKQFVEVSFLDLQCCELFGLAVFALANSSVSDRAILIIEDGQSNTRLGFVLFSTGVLNDSIAVRTVVPEGSFHVSPRLDEMRFPIYLGRATLRFNTTPPRPSD